MKNKRMKEWHHACGMVQKMKKAFFLAVIAVLLAGVFLPGFFLDIKSRQNEDEVHAVSKKYLSSSAAMAKNASLNLKTSNRLELVAGEWESDIEEAKTYEMLQGSYEAVMRAKEELKNLYDRNLYPLDMEGYGKWYSWNTVPYKAVDTTFHTYTAFYWVITFQKYDGSDSHEIWMLDDGTLFLAYAKNIKKSGSFGLKSVSDVLSPNQEVRMEDADSFVPALYRNLDITGMELMSECVCSKQGEQFCFQQYEGKEKYLYLLLSAAGNK